MGIRDAIRAIDAASRTESVVPADSWHVVTKPDGYKFVSRPARDIAARLGFPADRLSLAALAQSEVGSLPAQYLYAVVEAVQNEATARGVSPTALLVDAGKAVGHYGGQSGRYAATGQRPTKRSHAAALAVENRLARGFAKGARRFFDPKVQDGGIQAEKKLEFDALQLIRRRYTEGWRWIGAVGEGGEQLLDPYILMLLSRDGRATLEDAEAAILDGRKRWRTGGALPPIEVAGGGLVLVAALAGAAYWWS